MVLDADGAALAVELAIDENGRLFDLRVIRCQDGDVINPDWSTLRALERDPRDRDRLG